MEFRCLCPGGIPGYGWGVDSFRRALELEPDAIIAQGTSTDIGPAYLGTNRLLTSPAACERDLDLVVSAAVERGIPFVVSVGGGGNDAQLERSLDIVRCVAAKQPRRLRVAVVSGEVDRGYLEGRLTAGVSMPSLAPSDRIAPSLMAEHVREAECVVAQSGPEVVQHALSLGVDGVVTGRTLDAGLFAALPLARGFDEALSWGFAQVINDDGVATTPAGVSDGALIGILRDDHFDLVPGSPRIRCTRGSVLAAMIRERDDPEREAFCGGVLDFRSVEVEELPDGRSVRLRGFEWSPTPYAVKLEGVRRAGYRSIVIAGMRDPDNIARYDALLDALREKVRTVLALPDDSYRIDFISYGRDGVLGAREPLRDVAPHEIGLVVDVVARTQEEASAIAQLVRSSVLHTGYPGRKSNEGNVAFPLAPPEIDVGPVHVWSIWHALPLDDPLEPFAMRVEEMGG